MAESKKIGDFFAQYKTRLRAPQKSVEIAACEAIAMITGIKIPESKIIYKVGSKSLIITASSLLRSEIKARESEIIARLKSELGARNTPEVII